MQAATIQAATSLALTSQAATMAAIPWEAVSALLCLNTADPAVSHFICPAVLALG